MAHRKVPRLKRKKLGRKARRQKKGDLPPTQSKLIRQDLMTAAAKRDRRIDRAIERRANIRRALAERHSPYRDYVAELDEDQSAIEYGDYEDLENVA